MATSPDTHLPPGHRGSSNTMDASTITTRQLDFYTAMADFRAMFPSLDEEVIEAVLRANNGAVDATIDQLLTMNIDSGSGETLDTEKKEKLVEDLGDSSSTDEDDAPPYPPPSYNEYTNMPPSAKGATAGGTSNWKERELQALAQMEAKHHSKSDDLMFLSFDETLLRRGRGSFDSVDSSGVRGNDDEPILPPKMSLLEHSYTVGQQRPISMPPIPKSSKHAYRNWNPPMLGSLPEDFLRIALTQHQQHQLHQHTMPYASNPSSTVSSPRKSPARSKSIPSASVSPSRNKSCGKRPQRTLSAAHGRDELNTSVLQQKIAENERKRSLVANPEQARYLEDERLALLAQNEEFLTILRQDEDFMKALERDHMNATAFEPKILSIHHEDQRRRDEPLDTVRQLDPNRPPADQLEGYGGDTQEELGAFPFSQPMPKDENAELRRQLSHMGGTTKKKFATLARKFFVRKKKKTPQRILKGTSAPSTMNLLEDEDDDDDSGHPRDPNDDAPISTDAFVPDHMTVMSMGGESIIPTRGSGNGAFAV